MSKIRHTICDTVIESKHSHDFVVCPCWDTDDENAGGGVFLDGGDEYFRIGGDLGHIMYILPDGTEKPFELQRRNESESNS